MMDKPAIPLSSSSSFQQYHQYIHSSAMQLQPFLRTRPLQLCHGGLQGALRNYHPLWHEPPHQMWQIKHLKKAFFGNKSTKISLEAILTVHIIYICTWKIAVMIAIAALGFWAPYPCLIPSEGAPRVETQTPWEQHWNDAITVVTEKGARLKHTKSNQKMCNEPFNQYEKLEPGREVQRHFTFTSCLVFASAAYCNNHIRELLRFFVSWSGNSLVVTSFFHCGFVSPFGLLSATTLGRIQLHIFGGELQLCSIGARLWRVKPESVSWFAIVLNLQSNIPWFHMLHISISPLAASGITRVLWP